MRNDLLFQRQAGPGRPAGASGQQELRQWPDMVTTASQEQLMGSTLAPLTVEGPKGGRMLAAGTASAHSAILDAQEPTK